MSQGSIKHAYTIGDLDGDPFCKSSIYNAIRDGRLRAVKFGRRTSILPADWQRFLAGLPAIAPTAAAPSVPVATNGRRPRGRPRKIPLTPSGNERVPLAENVLEVPGHDPAPPLEKRANLKSEPDRVSKKSPQTTERGGPS
jgi:hypothetical protein